MPAAPQQTQTTGNLEYSAELSQRQIDQPTPVSECSRQNDQNDQNDQNGQSTSHANRQILPVAALFADVFSTVVFWFSSNLNQRSVLLTSSELAADDSRKMSRSCSAREG